MLCFSYLPYPLQSYYVLFYFKNSLDFFLDVLFAFKYLSSVAGLEFQPVG